MVFHREIIMEINKLECKKEIRLTKKPRIDVPPKSMEALAERFALNKSSGDYVIRPPSSGLSKATIDCLRPFFSNLEGDHISIK
ncbi:hypothetical protein IFM89_023737, partial [Coptis chinensis]